MTINPKQSPRLVNKWAFNYQRQIEKKRQILARTESKSAQTRLLREIEGLEARRQECLAFLRELDRRR